MGVGALAAQLGVDLIGTAYGIYQDQRNFDYQKDLQKKLFEREDNAVQRRRADLEAAGINPNLAAGSAAGAGQVAATGGTSKQINSVDILGNIVAYEQAKASQLEFKRFAFNNRIDQIFQSGADPSEFFVTSDYDIIHKSETKLKQASASYYDDDGKLHVKTVLSRTYKDKPVYSLSRSPAYQERIDSWQQFKNDTAISNNSRDISDNQKVVSDYDTENYRLDRNLERVEKGLETIGNVVSDAARAYGDVKYGRNIDTPEAREQRDLRKYGTQEDVYVRTKNGYTKKRFYRFDFPKYY